MPVEENKIAKNFTIEEFKANNNIANIELLQVEGRETRFWSGNGLSGAISSKTNLSQPLQMLEMEDGGYVLCNKGEGANVLATI